MKALSRLRERGVKIKSNKKAAHCAAFSLQRIWPYFNPAALRSSSALSVFSHENDVAVCFLPAAST